MGGVLAAEAGFDIPINLHYSQTLITTDGTAYVFDIPMNLHYSQTCCTFCLCNDVFDIPMNLHYSQTFSDILCSIP